MKKFLCLAIVLFLASVCCAQTDTLLTCKVFTVTEKSKCISGNKHNYESLAYYFWPDPKNPDGKYICKDGQPSPEYKYYDGQRLLNFRCRLVTILDKYKSTQDARYARKCVELISAWFLNTRTKMLPNFDYGQFIPGYRDGRGNQGSISEAYHFVAILDCIDELHDGGFITQSQYRKLQSWFYEFGEWMQTSSLGKEMHDAPDNLCIMYDILLCRICTFTGDRSTVRKITDEFADLRLNKHVAEDGSQPQELKRANAFHYSIFNLQHIIDFCYLAEENGIHFYAQHRKRIDAAMAYLMQFVGHKNKFPYKEVGNWQSLEAQLKAQQRRIVKLRSY